MKKIMNQTTVKQFMNSSKFQDNFSFDVSSYVELFHFSSQDYIVKEGNKPEYLYYLVKGSAKFYITLASGKVALIDFFKACCFIGEVELISDSLEAKSVQAIEDCWCLALNLAKYKNLIMKDNHFLTQICLFSFEKNHRNIISSMHNQSFKLENRFANFILLSSSDMIYNERHTLTSQYLGVSYRHLLQVLSDFIKKGYLCKVKQGYQIKNKNALKQLAKEIHLETLGYRV